MGRYVGPACRLCRREGSKLFLKGNRCYMAKCPITTERPVPGGKMKRHSKLSDYGTQLREKQKLRRVFGMMERQFRLFFQRAVRSKAITGEKLLQMLEMRLDNIVYRLGFAASRRSARQFINHGHILVNGRKATIASMVLKANDVVEVANRVNSRQHVEPLFEVAESRGIVAWLALDKAAFKGKVLHVPKREEITEPVNEQLIVELYSK